MLHGNTEGLSPSDVDALERLHRRRVPFEKITTPELTRSLIDASRETGRQIGVLVSRRGEIEYVIVGDATKLFLPDLGRVRAAEGRFRGLHIAGNFNHLVGHQSLLSPLCVETAGLVNAFKGMRPKIISLSLN